MAAPFIPIFPEPSRHEDILFDGRCVTAWLEEMEVIFDQYRLDKAFMVKQLPQWTKDRSTKQDVKTTLNGIKSWDEARKALLRDYKAHDPRQQLSYTQKLRQLSTGSTLEDPLEIDKLLKKYATLIRQAKAAKSTNIDQDSYVESILLRLSTTAIRDIKNHSQLSLGQLKVLTFEKLRESITEWVNDESELGSMRNRGPSVTSRSKAATTQEQDGQQSDRKKQVSFEESDTETSKTVKTTTPRGVVPRPPSSTDESILKLSTALKEMTINFQDIQSSLDKQTKEIKLIRNTHAGQSSHNGTPMNYADAEQLEFRAFPVQRSNGAPPNGAGRSQAPPPPGARLYDNFGQFRGGGSGFNGPQRCFFCHDTTHFIGMCPLARGMANDGFIVWSKDNRSYYLHGNALEPNGDSNAGLWIPNEIVDGAKQMNQPVGYAICCYIKQQGIGGKRAGSFATYWLTKFDGKMPKDSGSTERSSQAAGTSPEQKSAPTATINSVMCDIDKSFSEGYIDYGWAKAALSDDGTQLFKAIIKPESEIKTPPTNSIKLNAVKRRRGSDGEPIDVEESSAEQISSTQKTSPVDVSKMWTQLIKDNARQNFKITWGDMISLVPGFSDAVREHLIEAARKADMGPVKVIRVSADEAAKEAALSEQATRPTPGGDILNVVLDTTGGQTEPQRRPGTGGIAALNDPNAYYRPHLRLTVRIGFTGEERPITAIVDSGAESSIIASSYVQAHNIPMRHTDLK
ncbi:hypothetical protein GGR53DRAFT_191920 [Hypoxylon sp. FL1150]|nr:hypothetical protein GGR53DRAFT_191920 [Hypoxylon sp. FL1150]